jgi:hypothetical protein
MPRRTFDRLLETGLLNPPGPDGRWPASELGRIERVMELGRRGVRDLNRRVLLLPWEGPEFAVDLVHRRKATEELLKGDLRPAGRKMREVRRELDVLYRRTMAGLDWPAARKPRNYGMRLPQGLWWFTVQAADDPTLQGDYQLASFYAQILPNILRAEGIEPEIGVPPEERLAFILVNLLLRHPEPRRAVGLAPLPVRRGPDIA